MFLIFNHKTEKKNPIVGSLFGIDSNLVEYITFTLAMTILQIHSAFKISCHSVYTILETLNWAFLSQPPHKYLLNYR